MESIFNNITDKLNQNRHSKLWLLLVIVCICLLILAFVKINSHTSTTGTFSTPNTTSSSMNHHSTATKTYTDTQNYIRIKIPANWRTEQESGTNTTFDNTSHQHISQQIEISKLYLSDNDGITFQVYKGIPICPLNQSLNSTLAGFPASYNAISAAWTIPTSKATVTVSIFYPGSIFDYHEFMQNGASPLSSSEIEKNKSYIMGILNTLELPTLTPYSCK